MAGVYKKSPPPEIAPLPPPSSLLALLGMLRAYTEEYRPCCAKTTLAQANFEFHACAANFDYSTTQARIGEITVRMRLL